MAVEARFVVADSDAPDGKRQLNETDFAAGVVAALQALLPTALESGRLKVRADGTVTVGGTVALHDTDRGLLQDIEANTAAIVGDLGGVFDGGSL